MASFKVLHRVIGAVQVFCENTYYASGLAMRALPTDLIAANLDDNVMQLHDLAFLMVATIGLTKWMAPYLVKIVVKLRKFFGH
jgi:hypothetical protein